MRRRNAKRKIEKQDKEGKGSTGKRRRGEKDAERERKRTENNRRRGSWDSN